MTLAQQAAADRILLVGCGNMGGAMLRGWISQGRGADIDVVTPRPETVPVEVRASKTPEGPLPRVLVLAVKPQKLASVAPAVVAFAGAQTILLSVLAAVEIDTLRHYFPAVGAIVRAVPNLPAQLGVGVTALSGESLDPAGADLISALCSPLGRVEWLEHEALIDAATSVSGCGPAFLFRFAEAAIDAGMAQGLSAGQARRLFAQTMVGAGRMLAESVETPRQMVGRVASPGGVTLAGLAVFDSEERLSGLVNAALAAAAKRSAAMAEETRPG